MSPADAPLEVAQAAVAMLLLGLACLAVPRALLLCAEIFRAEPPTGWLLVAAVLLGAGLRWAVAPLRMATSFAGYDWTARAIELYPVPHYGAGAFALYHTAFALLPHDHRSLMALNALLGVLVIPLAASWVASRFDARAAGVATAFLIALSPILIRNDTSDAKNVPILVELFAGLVLVAEHGRVGRRAPLVLGMALLCLASVSRPEMPALVAALLAVTLLGAGRASALDRRWFFGLAAVAVALSAPHLLHIAHAITELQAHAGLPRWSGQRLVRSLFRWNAVAHPELYPAGLLWLALLPFGLAERSLRASLAALAGAALLAVVIYAPDLDDSNMARVHAPAAVLVTCLAGIGAAALSARCSRWAALGLVLLAAATGAPSVAELWRPTNADEEERLIRDALEALPPDSSYTLVRSDHGDRAAGLDAQTHDAFPDYLFEGATFRSYGAWIRRPDWTRPAYALVGVRCYASFRHPDSPVPPGDNEQPWCAELRRRFDLDPVIERAAPNHGDVRVAYYGRAPTLRIGLYRLRPREE